MNTRDQFGNYLLLKKLGEDALGETFRAGRLGKQGVERVVLLRVFNGQGLDGERLGQQLATRATVQQALKSPNIGQGVDLGQVRGVPYVAYDYISGKSLSSLLEQAQKKRSPVPNDHALLIVERIAQGLALACETKINDERVLHGFLTPHMVMVSNEGEIRLLGFEAAPALRPFAGHPLLREAFGRYLAPEVLAGQGVHKSDDVWSLGVLLYELLTGQKLPTASPAALAPALEQATIAGEGTPVPPELLGLLQRSLVARDQRIGDAVTWHKTLSKLMVDGQYNPTTFNLAFFMHNLFREEIERESQEIESERTIQVPVVQIQSGAAPAAATGSGVSGPAAPAAPPVAGVREDTQALRNKFGIEEPPKRSNMAVMIGAAAGVIVLAIVGYLLFGTGGAAKAPAPAPAAPAAPTGPTPEELQAQMNKMIEEKIKAMEAGKQAEYEEKIKAVQKQLDEARKAAADRAAERSAPAPASTSAPVPAPAPATTAAPPPSPSPAVTTPATSTPPPAPAPAIKNPEPAAPTSTAPTPMPAPAEPVAAAPEPAAGQVRVGDLVTFGAGVLRPRVVRHGNVNYPQVAKRMNREAVVTVRVLVDENGKVLQTDVPQKVGMGFDEAAVVSARDTSFSPATKNGTRVKMWYDLKVVFSLKN